MSLLKIKIVYEDDIRMFKTKSDPKEIFNEIISFVKETHDIKRFRLVFKDEENDEITITDNDDLQEALNSNSNKKIAKLYVKNIQHHNDEEEKESEEEINENDNTKDETSDSSSSDSSSDDSNNGCKWLSFLDDMSQDKELKDEFISFLTTFLLSLKNEKENQNNYEGNLNNGSELFIKALSLYPKLKKHEAISLFVSEKLNSLFYQFPHLLNKLKQIDIKDIPKLVNLIIDFNNIKNNPRSNHFSMLPPFLFPFLDLFNGKDTSYINNTTQGSMITPFCFMFGSVYNHKGRHHRGHGRHHHGRKHGHGHGYGHGRKFFGGRGGCRGGMRKQCGHGFFNKSHFEKDKDLRVDIINENITLGRNAFVNGNQTLVKTWKLKNVGKVIPSNCSIEYVGRKFNLMIDGTKFELKNKQIEINEEFEVSVVVKSPNNNGKYKSKWKLVTPNGNEFGQPLIVSFIVNDNSNNTNINKEAVKQLKKLMKQHKSNFKKQSKFLRKEDKMNKREEKIEFRKEKLRNRREKLLKKLEELEQQTSTLNHDENNNNNNNNNDKDDDKEEVVVEENVDISVDNSNNDNVVNDEEEDVVIINDKVTSEGDDKFIYHVQLEQLKNMGFDDENKLKQLLEINDGSVQAVLNNIM